MSYKLNSVISALYIALGAGTLTLSSTAYAQSSEGSLYGTALPNAKVTIISVDTGATRDTLTDATGSYAFSKLPPGKYRVSSGEITQEVNVAIGSGTKVTLRAVDIERVSVTGSRLRSAIDVNSTETNSVFTQEQIQALPVPRSVDAVSLLAPGAVKASRNFNVEGSSTNQLASFGGASVAENGYYINGFDVTNIRNFTSYAEMPFDAIAQQQVKTGGYGAEFGRSLGGVVSLVTRSGTNEWKGGVAMYYEPRSLQSSGKNVPSLEPTQPGVFTLYEKDRRDNKFSYNLYGGGPLIQDKLFFFGLAEGRNDTFDTYAQVTNTRIRNKSPGGLIKVDFLPTEDHRLEYTKIFNKKKEEISDFTNSVDYSTAREGTPGGSVRNSGGDVQIAKYTGYLTDKFTLSATAGRVDYLVPTTTGARVSNQDCPVVLETDLSEIGCWSFPFPGEPVRDASAQDDKDRRKAFRLDLEYVLGDHTIKGGYDSQNFESYAGGQSTFSGGVYYRYFVTPASGIVNGVSGALPPGTQYVRGRVINRTSGAYEVDNKALYIEDSWNVTKNVLLYGGLRSESFENKNGDGASFVKKENLLAPRLGASWDVMGDSSLKVFGNAGRYYIPVASNTNIRATGGELFETRFYSFSGRDPRTQGPLGLTQIGAPLLSGDGTLPNPGTVADTDLKPMSQDEFILGFQKALSKDFAFGVKGIYRKVNNGVDDYCGHESIGRWAADNGYTSFDTGSLATCMLVNPGKDLNINLDLNNDGSLTKVTIPNSYLGLANYERTYRAIELSFEKPYDGKWGLQGSYTWSKSKGTAEGYIQSDLGQEDAGITQDFDFGSFTDGSKGYLPSDRRHVFKLFGTYGITSEFRVGANFVLASGRPKSCIGFVPPTVVDYADSGVYTSASSYYCLNEQGETVLGQRGNAGRTPWTKKLDLQFAYIPDAMKGKLTLQIDIFNVFNTQEVVEVNQVRDFSRQTSGTPPGQLSQNYGQPIYYQDPRAVRLAARYEF